MLFAKIKQHYEAVVAVCCFLILFTNVGLPSTSFSVYQPYLVDLPGVGHSGGSIIVSVRTFVSLLAMLVVGRYYDLVDCRIGAFLATLSVSAGFALYSFAGSNFGMLCGASALTGLGYGFGGMIILPIVGRLIAAYGYQVAYRCHALGGILLLLVTLLMIEDNPEKVGTKAYGYEKAEEIAAAVAAKKEKESRQGGLDLATARKTPSYWLMWVGLAISSFPGVAFRFYNGAFFRGPIGLDTVTYSNWASVLSVCIAVGMILMGVMADKIGSVKMVVLMHVISIAGYACAIVLMKNTGSFALLLITVILCGMNGPLDNATAPYLIPEAFGRKYYDEIIGSYAGAMMIGNVCVPMLLGNIISDGTAASFGLAWEIIIGFSAVAMVILLVGLFRGPYRKQYLALKAEESQMKKSGAEV